MFRQIIASIVKTPPLGTASRTFASFARPLTRPTTRVGSLMSARPALPSFDAGARVNNGPASIFDIVSQQRRFKSRGNTYQPSMLKRKRRAGFLARLRTRGGRKILERRRAKGRWFLTY